MRFPKHVSLGRDVPLMHDVSPGILGIHDAIIPTPPVVKYEKYWPFVEQFVPNWWIPGQFTGAHQLTSTVFHNNWAIAQKKHDCGPMIPHIGDLVLFLVHTLNSSRGALFEAGEVKMDGKPVACCTFVLDGMPTPMAICSFIPIPVLGTSMVMTLWLNSVICGMHWVDFVVGCLRVVMEALLGILLGDINLGGKGGGARVPGVGGLDLNGVLGIATGPTSGSLASTGAEVYAAVLHLIAQDLTDYHGDAGVSLPGIPSGLERLGGPNTPEGIVRDGATGQWEAPPREQQQSGLPSLVPQAPFIGNPVSDMPFLGDLDEL